jgi:hypothetical protein
MSDLRKAKMLRNMALKEHARLPQFIRRQKILMSELEQLEGLLDRMRELRERGNSSGIVQANRLHTDRWYELRLIEEALTLQNKLEFLRNELVIVTDTIAKMSHRKQHVSEKAKQVMKQVRIDRENYQERTAAVLTGAQRLRNIR